MLYNTSNELKFNQTEKTEYLFDALPYNDDIDISNIAVLENFYKENKYIPSRYINMFLNYIIFYARKKVLGPIDNVNDFSFKGKCSITAQIICELLAKMNIDVVQFNIGDVIGTDKIHQICMVNIPTYEDGKIINKSYILDPTFRQFCLKEECRFERYNEEKRFAVRVATPHPGYFYNLTPEGKQFASDLITFGYFDANPDSIKQYFDAFALYVIEKEHYKNKDQVGLISSTDTTGHDYIEAISSALAKDQFNIPSRTVILTPLETIELERMKIKNRLKRYFTKKDAFTNLEFVDELQSTVSKK